MVDRGKKVRKSMRRSLFRKKDDEYKTATDTSIPGPNETTDTKVTFGNE